MAIMWNGSLIPWLDPSGAPYSGAKAYFFNAGTTTPRTVYIDSDLGESHDHPVVADASGSFPAIFQGAGDFRLRITTSADVTLHDVDGISVPVLTEAGGGGGDTPEELLFRTGMFVFRHGTGSLSGWVRAAGRTIGDAASGATERANADCQDLFEFLWDQDTTLTVSGGRGANAASDWAASKTIALPDLRQRALIGMASMGASLATLIAAGSFDGGEDGDDLGATVGAGTVTLTSAQMPTHNHVATAAAGGVHTHSYQDQYVGGSGGDTPFGSGWDRPTASKTTGSAGSHTHTITVQNAGSGDAHSNVQPSMVATCYLKL